MLLPDRTLAEAFQSLLHDCLAHPLQGVCHFIAAVSGQSLWLELGDAFHDTIGQPPV